MGGGYVMVPVQPAAPPHCPPVQAVPPTAPPVKEKPKDPPVGSTPPVEYYQPVSYQPVQQVMYQQPVMMMGNGGGNCANGQCGVSGGRRRR